MSIKTVREVDRFVVQADDGERFTIIVTQTFIRASTFGGNEPEIPGLKKAITTEGHHANFIDENTFVLIGYSWPEGKIVRRV